MKITITVKNDNPETIWNKLAKELGREPTNAECRERIRSILANKT